MSESKAMTKDELLKYRILWGECPDGKVINPKTGRCVKIRTPKNRLTWMQALKIYNRQNNGKWCTPMKGTVDWGYVKQIMKDGGVQRTPSEFEVVKSRTFTEPIKQTVKRIDSLQKKKRKIIPVAVGPSDGEASIPFGADIKTPGASSVVTPVSPVKSPSPPGPVDADDAIAMKALEDEIDKAYDFYVREKNEADNWSADDETRMIANLEEDIINIAADGIIYPEPVYIQGLVRDLLPVDDYSNEDRQRWVRDLYNSIKERIAQARQARSEQKLKDLVEQSKKDKSSFGFADVEPKPQKSKPQKSKPQKGRRRRRRV